MASPQKENGYCAISNEIMEMLARTRIPGQARQVLDCILRKTYGWNKREDQISLSQFMAATGLPKVTVCKALKILRNMNLITQKGNAKSLFTKKGNDIAVTYGFQKDFDKWVTLPKKVTCKKDVTQKGNNTLPKKGTTKDNIKPTNIKVQIPDWLDPEDWKDFKEHRKKLRKPMTDKAEKIMIARLESFRAEGHNPKHLLYTAIERGWQSVYVPQDYNAH